MPKVDDFGNEPPQLVGTIAVTISILCFGTQSIFIKSPQIIKAGVDPFLGVCYFSLGVCLCGSLLALALHLLSETGAFRTTYAGVYASCFYAPGNILLLWSARKLGVGLATGLVSTAASITGFLTGVLILGNPVHYPLRAAAGLLMLVAGAAGMAAVRMPSVQRYLASSQSAARSDEGGRNFESFVAEDDGEALLLPDDASTADANSKAGGEDEHGVSPVALVGAVGSGIFLGCQGKSASSLLQLDLELTAFLRYQGIPLSNGYGYPLRDAATFMMVQVVWTLIICGTALRYRTSSSNEWCWHWQVAALPSMIGGLIFSLAFVGQLYAILALTDSVGMPLSQLNLVVAGIWGVFYFREVRGCAAVTCFFLAATCACAAGPLI